MNCIKNVIISMFLMTISLIVLGGPINMFFLSIVGGGVEQTYIYPIYGGIIILVGVIVGSTSIIMDEIIEIKEEIKKILQK